MSYIPNLSPKNGAPLLSGFEALVIKTGGNWFGVRAKTVFRLLGYQAEKIVPAEENQKQHYPPLLGFAESGARPVAVLDLAQLLELPTAAETGEALQQILVVQQANFLVGLAIQSALEIERISINDVRLLPSLIETSLLKPVVWALWQRPNEELIPMVDPLAAIETDKLEWVGQQVAAKETKPAETQVVTAKQSTAD